MLFVHCNEFIVTKYLLAYEEFHSGKLVFSCWDEPFWWLHGHYQELGDWRPQTTLLMLVKIYKDKDLQMIWIHSIIYKSISAK
jgi:hypothetical protein